MEYPNLQLQSAIVQNKKKIYLNNIKRSFQTDPVLNQLALIVQTSADNIFVIYHFSLFVISWIKNTIFIISIH